MSDAFVPVIEIIDPSAASTPLLSWLKLISASVLAVAMVSFPPVMVLSRWRFR